MVDFDKKLITISKESVDSGLRQRVIYDVKNFQKALKNLKSYGVTDDFKIKGTSAPVNTKTVGEILAMKPNVDKVFGKDDIVMYHGTSKSKAEIVEREGLKPGKTPDVYNDLIADYSEHNVYLAVDPKTAEFYGKRQAKKDGDSQYVVFKVDVPDKAKIVADDAFAYVNGEVKSSGFGIKNGLKENGSVGYRGSIKPQFLSVFSTKKM